jgi:hypothetical protein
MNEVTQLLNAVANGDLRLVGGSAEPHWNGRGHFFATAAEAVRHIVVDNARRKRRARRGGGRRSGR